MDNSELPELDNTISSFYECGKCKLISKEHKEYLIEKGFLGMVIDYNHLFENGSYTTEEKIVDTLYPVTYFNNGITVVDYPNNYKI